MKDYGMADVPSIKNVRKSTMHRFAGPKNQDSSTICLIAHTDTHTPPHLRVRSCSVALCVFANVCVGRKQSTNPACDLFCDRPIVCAHLSLLQAVSFLDSFSIRLGVFLRRYPAVQTLQRPPLLLSAPC